MKIHTLALVAMLAFAVMQGAAEAQTSPSQPALPSETIPETLIGDLQRDLDLEEFQAAAIAGSLAQETGNFMILKQIKGPGLGYSQWSGSRKTEFKAYAGGDQEALGYEANYGFLVKELIGPYHDILIRVRKTQNIDEATRIFVTQFLRPSKKHQAMAKRVGFARMYLAGDFRGAGCVDSVHIGRGRLSACDS